MRVPRARVSFLAVVSVALAGAMLLVTPRGFDRVRPARAGSQRLDFSDAAHGAADDHTPTACALTPSDDGVDGGRVAPRTGAGAVVAAPAALPSPSFLRLPSPARFASPLAERRGLRPADRAPPHA